jgi:hypothetical protein
MDMPVYKFVAQNEATLQDFMRVYGRAWVYIKSPFPQLMKLQGIPGMHLMVWLDIDALTPDEWFRLVLHIAHQFQDQPIGVAVGMIQRGLPLMVKQGYVLVESDRQPPEREDG